MILFIYIYASGVGRHGFPLIISNHHVILAQGKKLSCVKSSVWVKRNVYIYIYIHHVALWPFTRGSCSLS